MPKTIRDGVIDLILKKDKTFKEFIKLNPSTKEKLTDMKHVTLRD